MGVGYTAGMAIVCQRAVAVAVAAALPSNKPTSMDRVALFGGGIFPFNIVLEMIRGDNNYYY